MDSQTTTPERRRRRWIRAATGIIALGVVVPTTVLALDALEVAVPLLPAVGESEARACDTDGVNTSYTYGNTSSRGIKVTSVIVDDISSDCSMVTVDFMNAETVVDTYTAAVAGTATTLTTNIFTDEFTSVRVLLAP